MLFKHSLVADDVFIYTRSRLIEMIVAIALLLLVATIFIIFQAAFATTSDSEKDNDNDKDDDAVVGILHYWNIGAFEDLTLSYVIDSKDIEFHKMVTKAVTTWEEELQPVLTFAKTRSLSRADISFKQVSENTLQKIARGNGEPADKEFYGYTMISPKLSTDGYPKKVWYDNGYPGTVDVNMYVLEKLPEVTKYSVILHEFGHALGLGHSENVNTLMDDSQEVDVTTITECESFMVFYINGLAETMANKGYWSEDYDDLIDSCSSSSSSKFSSSSNDNDNDNKKEKEEDSSSYSLYEDAEDSRYDFEYFWGELEPSEIDELCDASEDYDNFKEGCDYAYAHTTSPDWEDSE